MQARTISIFGAAASGSPLSLLFHYSAHIGLYTDQPSTGTSYAAIGLDLTGGQASSANAHFYRTQYFGGSTTFDVTPNVNGFDFLLPFDANAGLFSYSTKASASIFADGLRGGSRLDQAFIDAWLQGIDAVDADGNKLASVTLSNLGFDVLDFGTTVTPEPASLVLLATGLMGIYGALRHRRRQSRLS